MLKTNAETLEDNKVKLTVTIDSEKVDEAVKAAFKKLSKEVHIPGFRQGKIPRKMLEQSVGTEYVVAQAAEDLINSTYGLALDAESLRAIGDPDFGDPEELKEGAEFTYVVTAETRPELKLKSSSVEIAMPPRETTEAEIDAQMEDTRERLAGLEPVEDRAVEAGDFVMISFKSTLDGEAYEGSSIDKYMYELGQGSMPQDFETPIIGAKSGDKVVAEFVVEDLGENVEYAGKALHFDIEIHEIKQKVLPEANDEFATQAGFESIEDMRKEIKSYIDSQKAQSYDRILDERLTGALADRLDGEISDVIIESRKASLKREFESMLKERDIEFDQYLKMSNIDPEQYDEDLSVQASIASANDLALEALAREQNLEATQDDVAKEFEEIATALNTSVEEARAKWTEFGLITSLHDEIARKKALEWLRKNATVTIDESAN
ncbi:MAG: trigger factor [Coriobacteriia bacterium]|nr:trigger factor [Coriobacteriia bacterium]